MRYQRNPIRRASYSITSFAHKQLRSKRVQLETKRTETLEEMKQLGKSKTLGLSCLAIGMQKISLIDQELNHIDTTLRYAVIIPETSSSIAMVTKVARRRKNKNI